MFPVDSWERPSYKFLHILRAHSMNEAGDQNSFHSFLAISQKKKSFLQFSLYYAHHDGGISLEISQLGTP